MLDRSAIAAVALRGYTAGTLPARTGAAADPVSSLAMPRRRPGKKQPIWSAEVEREMENEEENYWNESIKTFLERKSDRIERGTEIWETYRKTGIERRELMN